MKATEAFQKFDSAVVEELKGNDQVLAAYNNECQTITYGDMKALIGIAKKYVRLRDIFSKYYPSKRSPGPTQTHAMMQRLSPILQRR